MKNFILENFLIFLSVSIVLLFFSITSFFIPNHQKILKDNGYTNIELNGWVWFGCSNGDYFLNNRKFTATNLAGNRIKGSLCCGVFKNCTIRF